VARGFAFGDAEGMRRNRLAGRWLGRVQTAVTLLDLELGMAGKLRSLPYDTYLKVMYGLLEQYRVIYREALSLAADALLDATAALVRGDGLVARNLTGGWRTLEEEAILVDGLLNLYIVAEFLSGELTGEYPQYAGVEGSTLPITNHLAVHPLVLLDSTEWPGHPGAALVRCLEDVATIDDDKQGRIAASPFDEVGRIIFN
jgi:hypothetical protein